MEVIPMKIRVHPILVPALALALGLALIWAVAAAAEDEGDVDRSDKSYEADTFHESDATGVPAPGDTTKNAGELAGPIAGIRWLGHAAFLIEDGKRIYIDPFRLGQGLPTADLVLITHDHSDHLSPADLKKIVGKSTTIVSIAAAKDELSKMGTFKAVKPGDTLTVAGVRIEVVPAYNPKKQFHPKEKGYVGYVIHSGGRAIYHAGDTDVIPEMKSIKADVALLPVGGTYTMDAKEAARAADLIKPKVAIPMHYGTLLGGNRLGSDADADTFKARAKVPVVILKIETQPSAPAKKSD
jgi:L-ascorbate metabolism protein UlaG (beta-lactamase superfamily)